jgi:TrmH family RNA methyltransferase
VVDDVANLSARTWITLCNPADPRNVGGAIRACANFGYRGIRIVTQTDFDPRDLLCFSSEALLTVEVQFFTTLDECLADQHLVIGTTRRQRDPNAPSMCSLREVGSRLPTEGEATILFGAERTGLVAEEVERCQELVWIPTSEQFPSMNLAHAVAVVGYGLGAESQPTPNDLPSPQLEKMDMSQTAQECFYRSVHENLLRAQYPSGRHPQGFLRRLRRFLSRANPTQQELGLLGGVFAELARLSGGDLPADSEEEKPGKEP